MAGVMRSKEQNWRIIPKTNRKKPDRYERNREHIRQVKRRIKRQQRERIKEKLLCYKRILLLCGSLVMCIFISLSIYGILRAVGKSRLYDTADTEQPAMQIAVEEETVTETERSRWKEGWVKYRGEIYEYKEDILTFLVMGIDKNSDVKEVEEGTDGGQADALFLAVVDATDKSVKIIGINRNSMTDIKVYDEKGEYVDTVKAQIAVQHGFGNGMEESCEYQKEAVTKLFYGLPIHGYVAINMSAIATINDAVGGVDVTVLEDLTKKDKTLIEGEEIHLTGKSAFWYLQYRDTNAFGSADLRLARQKQYLNCFINTAKKAAQEDVSIVFDLYKAIMPQMVTDVTLDEVAYLAPMLLEYRFNEDSFRTMDGETVMGEQFEEFYPDESSLYELILEIFYEKVDQSEF